MKTAQKLSNWSWQSLQSTYEIYAKQFKEYSDFYGRVKVPRKINIKYSDTGNTFILRFWKDVNRLDQHLKVLEKEINRRSALVGVL